MQVDRIQLPVLWAIPEAIYLTANISGKTAYHLLRT